MPLPKDSMESILSFGRGESLPPATSWNLGAATRLFILAVIAKDNWKGGKIMLFQIYDYYRDVYFGEKGQDLIEYALLLALIVAVGVLIYQTSGLKESLSTIFTNANTLAKTAASVSGNATKASGT